MAKIDASTYVAETVRVAGISHVFFVPVVLTRALVEMERLGIVPVMTHGEKAAAYMADGYARIAHQPGICLSQTIGAANLAAGLRDAFWQDRRSLPSPAENRQKENIETFTRR